VLKEPRGSALKIRIYLPLILLLTGCEGSQSALDPASRQAEELSALFWGMTIGSGVILAAVVALTMFAIRSGGSADRRRQARFVVVAGAVVPAVVLAGLLIFGLGLLQGSIAPAPAGSLRIAVHGEQWWWRFRYEPTGAPSFEVANEIQLPVGEPVEFLLHSNNVIHSFWIPSLGGKMDMIPGRINRLSLPPNKVGRFRGVCAEYCGAAHAKMAFDVVVTTKDEFSRWMTHQAEPAP